MSIVPQPARPASQNAKHAATFFTLSLIILLIPIFLPTHRSTPSTQRSVAQAPPLSSSSPGPAPTSQATPQATFVGPTRVSPTPQAGQEIDWSQPEREGSWGPSSEFRDKLHTVAMSLLLITALVFLTVKALQKYFPGLARPVSTQKPLMSVLAQHTVAPGVHLSLVQVCNKNVLIGFTEHSVNVLCEISPEEMEKSLEVEPEALGGAAPSGPGPSKTPGQVYKEILHHYLSIIPGFGAKR